MTRIFIHIALFTFLLSGSSYAQDKIELKNADELKGKVIDGKNVREATGNVILEQGNIKVYCNSAVQYIDENRVELTGNVKILQDTLSLFTSRGVYDGNEKKATGRNGVTLKDPNATLTASNGIYYFNDTKAIFNGNVKIVNEDYTITSDELTYIRNTEDSFAKGNVIVTTDSAITTAENIDFFKRQGKTVAYVDARIDSDSTIITSDSLINFSQEKKSFASGNVKIENLRNNVLVYGDYLENYEDSNYSKISGNTRLIQIEEDKNSNKKDTLFIYSKSMEAFRNIPEYYVATDSVEIIRDEFLSKCGKAIYYKDSETVSLSIEPIVWQDNSQMTGDSIYADLPGNKLQTIYIRKLSTLPVSKTSFVISSNDESGFSDRYNQVSGTDITMNFVDEKINLVDVTDNSTSIYFIFEGQKGNGVNKSEGKNMKVYFDEEEKVSRISIESEPVGQYIPEIKIAGENLFLPGFDIREDKPERR